MIVATKCQNVFFPLLLAINLHHSCIVVVKVVSLWSPAVVVDA
jgi:hypothetical protein